jgi:hypothetical protein
MGEDVKMKLNNEEHTYGPAARTYVSSVKGTESIRRTRSSILGEDLVHSA